MGYGSVDAPVVSMRSQFIRLVTKQPSNGPLKWFRQWVVVVVQPQSDDGSSVVTVVRVGLVHRLMQWALFNAQSLDNPQIPVGGCGVYKIDHDEPLGSLQ